MSWPLVKLKDCCRVVGGATPKRNIPEYWASKDIPWVTPKDISKLSNKVLEDAPEYISQLGFDKCATYLLPKGSVLLTSRAPIGNVAIAGRDMCTNQGFKSLVPTERVDSTYLYYCMLSHSPKLEALGNGATFKEVSKKIVEEFEIPLPPLEEQKRIAAILDKADSIRQKRKQAIELADEFLRSVFLDMFGDPVANPKGWEVRTLGELATKVTDGEHQTPKRSDKGFKLLSARNIQQGYIDIESEKVDYVGEAEFQRITKRLSIRKSDVLLSCSGTIGRVSMNTLNEPFCLVRSVAVIRLAENGVSPEYLVGYLGTSAMQSVMKKEANSSGQPNLFQNQIKQLKVLVPPLEIQNKYKELCDYFVSKKGSLDRAEEHQTELFRSLSQKAFSGQL